MRVKDSDVTVSTDIVVGGGPAGVTAALRARSTTSR